MLTSPNFLRPGVCGGFVLSPPQLALSAQFTVNSTWIGISPVPSGWTPTAGAECAFSIGDPFSGLALIVGTCFNWRGPWKSGTSYALGDLVAALDLSSIPQAYLCTTAWGGGGSFDYTKFRLITFRGAWTATTAYAAGDVFNANDINGNLQSWVVVTGFTSGSVFTPGPQVVGALAASTVFYVVGVEPGQIQISTSPVGAPITFASNSLWESPASAANLPIAIASAGFGTGTGLTPTLSIGALFAQGVLYQPATAPVLPAAPSSRFSFLGYNSSTGFYWTTNPAGNTAGDAVLGWVVTNATDILQASNQNIRITGSSSSSAGSGATSTGVQSVGGGGGTGGGAFAGLETMTPDVSFNVTPDCAKGTGHYAGPLAHAINVKPSINAVGGMFVLVVIYQPASGAGYAVTFDAAYKGISEEVVDTKAGTHTNAMFQVQPDGSHLRVWFETGVLSA